MGRTVVPASTKGEEIPELKPDGIFLSNGPGDPRPLDYAIDTARKLIETPSLPMFGICLGHQILSQVFGAKTFKMTFGHRGSNHPVQDLQTEKVEITWLTTPKPGMMMM